MEKFWEGFNQDPQN